MHIIAIELIENTRIRVMTETNNRSKSPLHTYLSEKLPSVITNCCSTMTKPSLELNEIHSAHDLPEKSELHA